MQSAFFTPDNIIEKSLIPSFYCDVCIKGICFYGRANALGMLCSSALVTPERGHKRKSS